MASLLAIGLPHLAALALSVILPAAGQTLLSMGASHREKILASFLHPLTLAGYAVFVAGTVACVFAMQKVDLKTGSTWAALTYPLVALSAWFILREPFSLRVLAGCLCIVFGVSIFHA
jgi:drug/metabolite transporter (DMT)-like permease